MKRLSVLTFVFAILSLVFIILLVFLRFPFPVYPLMSYQDAFDVLTPLVLIPVYYLLFRTSSNNRPSVTEVIAFMVLSAFWVEGQGMHLAANSIHNLMDALAKNSVLDVKGTDLFQLTYFFDEKLGHYLWHIGMLGLAALLIYREWRDPAGEATAWWPVIVGGSIYGLSYALIFLEGEDVFLGLPFAALVALLTLIWGRRRLARQPVLAFFFVACLTATLLFIGWGLYWGGFIPPSGAGII